MRWTLRRVHKYSAPYGLTGVSRRYRRAVCRVGNGASVGECRRILAVVADLVVVVRCTVVSEYRNYCITEFRTMAGRFRALKNRTACNIAFRLQSNCTAAGTAPRSVNVCVLLLLPLSCTRRSVGHRSSDQGQKVARMPCRRTARRVSLASACARVVIATLLSITEDVVHEHVDASLCAHRARGRHCCSRNSDRRCWQW